jgi:hypothetical protein
LQDEFRRGERAAINTAAEKSSVRFVSLRDPEDEHTFRTRSKERGDVDMLAVPEFCLQSLEAIPLR